MATPYFLAALPQLDDEFFSNAVILVVRHDADGAFGVILNKPVMNSEESTTQLVAEVKDHEGQTLLEFEQPLLVGGPVNDDSIYSVHEFEALSQKDVSICDGVYFSGDTEVVQTLMTHDADRPRRSFYLGMTSWESGQLESEFRTGTWLMVPFDKKFLFRENSEAPGWTEEFWKEILLHGGCDPLTLIGQGQTDFGPN